MVADILLRGAAIYTMDLEQPRARNLAITAGRIIACGFDDLEDFRGPGTRVFELPGRAVIPGFVDAHVHFGSYAITRQQVNLDLAAALEDGLVRLSAASQQLASGAWLRGRGWDRNRWGRLPSAADLDAVVGDRPAALASHDGHSLWLSTVALRAVGIDRATQPPPGGVIERDDRGANRRVFRKRAGSGSAEDARIQ